MTYRISQIEIPEGDPFKHDALDRKQSVEFLAGLIERAGERSLVLAIDAPYGSGKSTFTDMLRSVLAAKNFHSVHFNAWRVDHVSDPLVALVSALDEAMTRDGPVASKVKASLDVVRKVTTVVAKQGAVAAVKALTLGAVDLSEAYEEILGDLAENTTSDLVGAFQREAELIERFRIELAKAVENLGDMGKSKPLIFFIDELDRCRPDFAISLLERVKHMFDVPNLVFVLSVDKMQLQAATAAVYGERINAEEYLRKFIDLEFGLPTAPPKRFLDSTLSRAGIDELFAARRTNSSADDREHFLRVLSVLVEVKGLSLRAQERCITRMRLVLEQTPNTHYFDPVLVALLVVMRVTDQSMFKAIAQGAASPEEIFSSLRTGPEAEALLRSHDGRILEAALIAEDRDDARRARKIESMKTIVNGHGPTASDEVCNHAQHLLEIIAVFMRNGSRPAGRAVAAAAAKVDIAARLRD